MERDYEHAHPMGKYAKEAVTAMPAEGLPYEPIDKREHGLLLEEMLEVGIPYWEATRRAALLSADNDDPRVQEAVDAIHAIEDGE